MSFGRMGGRFKMKALRKIYEGQPSGESTFRDKSDDPYFSKAGQRARWIVRESFMDSGILAHELEDLLCSQLDLFQ